MEVALAKIEAAKVAMHAAIAAYESAVREASEMMGS
jgi:hypothetical protein